MLNCRVPRGCSLIIIQIAYVDMGNGLIIVLLVDRALIQSAVSTDREYELHVTKTLRDVRESRKSAREPDMAKDRSLQAMWVWVCLVLTGSVALVHYGSRPGEIGPVPSAWPDSSTLTHPHAGDRLLLFLHPQCPCSRATLRQLQTALVYAPKGLRVTAVIYSPSSESREWTQTALVQDVGALPGVEVVLDVDGRETNRFGARTSGHVMLYNPHNRLIFSGGITPARGHEGACAGLDGLIERLGGGNRGSDRAEVFGCPILDSKMLVKPGCKNCESHDGKNLD